MNFVYVFADQLSAKFLNIYGYQNKVETPNIDYLAKNGIVFENSYCTTPQCSPSRASLLTGLMPHRHGVQRNVDIEVLPLAKGSKTIGSFMKENGYVTGYFGKWHLGNEISDYGFDYTYDAPKTLDFDLQVTEAATDFLKNRTPSEPWLMMVSYNNPHDIYKKFKNEDGLACDDILLPESFSDTLEDKPLPQRIFRDDDQGKQTRHFDELQWKGYIKSYQELVQSIDNELGKIITALRENNLLDTTTIIFSSDHGDTAGAHRCPFKGPMLYDELINIPLIVKLNDNSYAGERRFAPNTNTDILPTILDYAGIHIPSGLDGASLAPVIKDKNHKVRDYTFIEYNSKQNWIIPIRCVIGDGFKYSLYRTNEEELYDKIADENERNNLAQNEEYASIKTKMKGILLAQIEKSKDNFFEIEITPAPTDSNINPTA